MRPKTYSNKITANYYSSEYSVRYIVFTKNARMKLRAKDSLNSKFRWLEGTPIFKTQELPPCKKKINYQL